MTTPINGPEGPPPPPTFDKETLDAMRIAQEAADALKATAAPVVESVPLDSVKVGEALDVSADIPDGVIATAEKANADLWWKDQAVDSSATDSRVSGVSVQPVDSFRMDDASGAIKDSEVDALPASTESTIEVAEPNLETQVAETTPVAIEAPSTKVAEVVNRGSVVARSPVAAQTRVESAAPSAIESASQVPTETEIVATPEASSDITLNAILEGTDFDAESLVAALKDVKMEDFDVAKKSNLVPRLESKIETLSKRTPDMTDEVYEANQKEMKRLLGLRGDILARTRRNELPDQVRPTQDVAAEAVKPIESVEVKTPKTPEEQVLDPKNYDIGAFLDYEEAVKLSGNEALIAFYDKAIPSLDSKINALRQKLSENGLTPELRKTREYIYDQLVRTREQVKTRQDNASTRGQIEKMLSEASMSRNSGNSESQQTIEALRREVAELKQGMQRGGLEGVGASRMAAEDIREASTAVGRVAENAAGAVNAASRRVETRTEGLDAAGARIEGATVNIESQTRALTDRINEAVDTAAARMNAVIAEATESSRSELTEMGGRLDTMNTQIASERRSIEDLLNVMAQQNHILAMSLDRLGR